MGALLWFFLPFEGNKWLPVDRRVHEDDAAGAAETPAAACERRQELRQCQKEVVSCLKGQYQPEEKKKTVLCELWPKRFCRTDMGRSRKGVESQKGAVAQIGEVARKGVESQKGAVAQIGVVARKGVESPKGAVAQIGVVTQNGVESREGVETQSGVVVQKGAKFEEVTALGDSVGTSGVPQCMCRSFSECGISFPGSNDGPQMCTVMLHREGAFGRLESENQVTLTGTPLTFSLSEKNVRVRCKHGVTVNYAVDRVVFEGTKGGECQGGGIPRDLDYAWERGRDFVLFDDVLSDDGDASTVGPADTEIVMAPDMDRSEVELTRRKSTTAQLKDLTSRDMTDGGLGDETIVSSSVSEPTLQCPFWLDGERVMGLLDPGSPVSVLKTTPGRSVLPGTVTRVNGFGGDDKELLTAYLYIDTTESSTYHVVTVDPDLQYTMVIGRDLEALWDWWTKGEVSVDIMCMGGNGVKSPPPKVDRPKLSMTRENSASAPLTDMSPDGYQGETDSGVVIKKSGPDTRTESNMNISHAVGCDTGTRRDCNMLLPVATTRAEDSVCQTEARIQCNDSLPQVEAHLRDLEQGREEMCQQLARVCLKVASLEVANSAQVEQLHHLESELLAGKALRQVTEHRVDELEKEVSELRGHLSACKTMNKTLLEDMEVLREAQEKYQQEILRREDERRYLAEERDKVLQELSGVGKGLLREKWIGEDVQQPCPPDSKAELPKPILEKGPEDCKSQEDGEPRAAQDSHPIVTDILREVSVGNPEPSVQDESKSTTFKVVIEVPEDMQEACAEEGVHEAFRKAIEACSVIWAPETKQLVILSSKEVTRKRVTILRDMHAQGR
ncbi:uncharacterized protein [Dendrobates tinctorius]|uniref:uncharacterized protein n=1 Tax=Dendrobates tinctorius TaxID=92724 RepID=UPI003CCA3C5D